MHHIAHVEDNLADHVLLKAMLKSDYKISHFLESKTLLASDEHFDLIISDLGLPDTYGYETIEKIRKAFPDTPVLTLTGLCGPYMTGDMIEGLLARGAGNVISKDIICDTRLLSVIKELIQNT